MRILYRSNSSDEFIFELSVTIGQSITLPLITGYSHDFTVIWGDGTANGKVTSYNDQDAIHTYQVAGTYVVKIRGKCQSFATNATALMRTSITRVIQWGTAADFRLLNFYGSTNLAYIPSDVNGSTAITGASNITTFAHLLHGCTSYTQALNDRIFNLCPAVTSFESTFESSGISGTIPVYLFRYNTLTTVFKRTFYSAASINGTIDPALYYYNTIAQSFQETFAYTAISGNVPSLLFTYCGANATNFRGTFRNTNLGNNAETLPGDLFNTNTNATDFGYTFCTTKYTCLIPELFVNTTLSQYFDGTFAATPWSGTIPVDLFRYTGTNALNFSYTFGDTAITGLPDHLFWYNTNATDFSATFCRCYSLQASNNGLGYNPINNVLFNQNTKALNFAQTFWDDNTLIVTLPEDMFWTNTKITNIWGCFAKVNIQNIPEQLLWNMPDVTDVSYLFYQGGGHTAYPNVAVPRDFFFYNTKIRDFSWCFRWRAITEIPDGLFRNNFLATSFVRCFESPTAGTKVNQYIFSESNDASAFSRFTGKTIDFTLFLSDSGLAVSFAPELWNSAKYDMVGNTHSYCYRYATSAKYSNYADIPTDWK